MWTQLQQKVRGKTSNLAEGNRVYPTLLGQVREPRNEVIEFTQSNGTSIALVRAMCAIMTVPFIPSSFVVTTQVLNPPPCL